MIARWPECYNLLTLCEKLNPFFLAFFSSNFPETGRMENYGQTGHAHSP